VHGQFNKMRLRANRTVERAGVNAARTFFEANGCVFQEVDGANDYGKDAYVDIGDGTSVTGTCAALQIKGGDSYRTSRGDYRIPVDDDHRRVWAESTIPIMGVVHDPQDDLLRWTNITAELRRYSKVTSIMVPAESILTRKALRGEFTRSIRRTAAQQAAGVLVGAVDDDEDTSISAIFDAFALGRSDARVLIGLRYLLRGLGKEGRRVAIHVLSHATPHPDIYWHEGNWIPETVKAALRPHFRWTRRFLSSNVDGLENRRTCCSTRILTYIGEWTK
jgi:hypothetical protein